MTRESSRTTVERCSFFSRKSGVFAVAVAYRKSGLWTYGRQSGRTWIAEAPVVRTFRVCAKKCDISASRVLSKHTSKLTRLCEKNTGLKWYCFCLFFFTQLESKKDSVDYLYEHQWIFSNQSRWKAFEMKSGGAFGRVRCAKGARGSANERRSPFTSRSFSNACYAGWFPVEKSFY